MKFSVASLKHEVFVASLKHEVFVASLKHEVRCLAQT